jgi:BolA protein
MDINELIAIVKKKLQSQIVIEDILIEDKSFLHKNHSGNQPNKFHLKISLKSNQLKKMKRIDSNKKIYRTLDKEMKEFIHSLQILIH